MKTMIAFLALLVGAVLLFGCDKNGNPIQEFGLDKLEKGVSTEGDVRTVMGQPDTVREETDGSRTLEYPKGPEGARTWMFVIDSSGKLRDYMQVLTEENFARIAPGMSKEEVRRRLGRPRSVVPFPRMNEEVWDWRYLSGTSARLFNVHFDMTTGQVKRLSSQDASEF
jgi:outer membrane protein assembly factor BamE (lipoprotein component of BamABCDE complex)